MTADAATPDVLAIFDLGHTLLPHDTDEQWIAFLIAAGKLDRVEYDSANRDLIARYKRGEAGALEFTEFYLSTLSRFLPSELERSAKPSCVSGSCPPFRRRRATSSRSIAVSDTFWC